jgi:type II secretory pathway pseudopilin PulG
MAKKRFGRLLDGAGYTVVEALTVVGVMGVAAAFSAPSVINFKAAQEVQSATAQVGGMLQRVRSRAIGESTPYLVLFQKEEVVDGERSPFALIVRDTDRSYSLTDPDSVETFALDANIREEVRQYGEAPGSPIYEDMVPPQEDRSQLVQSGLDSGGLLGGVTQELGGLLGGGGSSGSGSGSSGSGSSSGSSTIQPREPVMDTVTNGTTFPVSGEAEAPAIAFNERGIPVSPDSPQDWGSGAGAVYMTDNEKSVYAAVLSPLGEVSLGRYDASTRSWKK